MKTLQLAEVAGISAQAVRDYEANNLLPPVPRASNNYRNYTARHLAALLTIRALRAAGYLRSDITKIMDSVHSQAIHRALEVIDRHHAGLDARRRQIVAQQFADTDHARRTSMSAQPMTIGEAAMAVGVRASTLRFWESFDLLAVDRNQSSRFREYREADLDRLRAIKQMRSLDFDWDSIRLALGEGDIQNRPPMLSASEHQLETLGRSSTEVARATAMVWAYFLIEDDVDDSLVERIFRHLASKPCS